MGGKCDCEHSWRYFYVTNSRIAALTLTVFVNGTNNASTMLKRHLRIRIEKHVLQHHVITLMLTELDSMHQKRKIESQSKHELSFIFLMCLNKQIQIHKSYIYFSNEYGPLATNDSIWGMPSS
ncbi:unnamed protein product [Lupinus luteus]|uniref:Uncharacterized protein n=1 Tax=Lupinus luteus TaxID=3873 RepID=A0AAV1XYZ0_LUPLU